MSMRILRAFHLRTFRMSLRKHATTPEARVRYIAVSPGSYLSGFSPTTTTTIIIYRFVDNIQDGSLAPYTKNVHISLEAHPK